MKTESHHISTAW